jgi:hypothetical protein
LGGSVCVLALLASLVAGHFIAADVFDRVEPRVGVHDAAGPFRSVLIATCLRRRPRWAACAERRRHYEPTSERTHHRS